MDKEPNTKTLEAEREEKENQKEKAKEVDCPPKKTAAKDSLLPSKDHRVMVKNRQCKHSDGWDHEKVFEELTVVDIESGAVKRKSDHQSKKKEQHPTRKKVAAKRSSLDDIIKKDNDIATRKRYALDFPRHNWLVERLKSENKLDDGQIEKFESKVREEQKLEDEKLKLEKIRLEKIRRQNEQRIQKAYRERLEQTRKQIVQQRQTKSDTEVDYNGNSKVNNDKDSVTNVLSKSESEIDKVDADDSADFGFKILKVESLVDSVKTPADQGSRSPAPVNHLTSVTTTLEQMNYTALQQSSTTATVFKPKIIQHNYDPLTTSQANPFIGESKILSSLIRPKTKAFTSKANDSPKEKSPNDAPINSSEASQFRVVSVSSYAEPSNNCSAADTSLRYSHRSPATAVSIAADDRLRYRHRSPRDAISSAANDSLNYRHRSPKAVVSSAANDNLIHRHRSPTAAVSTTADDSLRYRHRSPTDEDHLKRMEIERQMMMRKRWAEQTYNGRNHPPRGNSLGENMEQQYARKSIDNDFYLSYRYRNQRDYDRCLRTPYDDRRISYVTSPPASRAKYEELLRMAHVEQSHSKAYSTISPSNEENGLLLALQKKHDEVDAIISPRSKMMYRREEEEDDLCSPPYKKQRQFVSPSSGNAFHGGKKSLSLSEINRQRKYVVDMCNYCTKTAEFVCSGCEKIWYCSRKCQLGDWRRHMPTCTA